LPSADQVAAHVRSVLDRIERSGGLGNGSLDMGNFSFVDSLMLDRSDVVFEDPFERRPGRGASSLSADDDESSSGYSENDRSEAAGRDRMRRELESQRDSRSPNPRRSEKEEFLQGLDLHGASSKDEVDNSPRERARTLIGVGQSGSVGWIGTRDSDAKAKAEERMERWRREMLGSVTASGQPGRGTTSGTDPLGPNLGGSQPRPGSPRSLLQNPTTLGTTGPVGSDPSMGDRPLSVPQFTPVDLDRNVGRSTGGNSRPGIGATTPPRPMDLFQRKHSNKIPTRVF
jgi:hypothetical protein